METPDRHSTWNVPEARDALRVHTAQILQAVNLYLQYAQASVDRNGTRLPGTRDARRMRVWIADAVLTALGIDDPLKDDPVRMTVDDVNEAVM